MIWRRKSKWDGIYIKLWGIEWEIADWTELMVTRSLSSVVSLQVQYSKKCLQQNTPTAEDDIVQPFKYWWKPKPTLNAWFRKITTVALWLHAKTMRLMYGYRVFWKRYSKFLERFHGLILQSSLSLLVFGRDVGMRGSLWHGATSNRRPDINIGMKFKYKYACIGRQLWAETWLYWWIVSLGKRVRFRLFKQGTTARTVGK
jgi:hypothetical protein